MSASPSWVASTGIGRCDVASDAGGPRNRRSSRLSYRPLGEQMSQKHHHPVTRRRRFRAHHAAFVILAVVVIVIFFNWMYRVW